MSTYQIITNDSKHYINEIGSIIIFNTDVDVSAATTTGSCFQPRGDGGEHGN
jgi:hypothetical protein